MAADLTFSARHRITSLFRRSFIFQTCDDSSCLYFDFLRQKSGPIFIISLFLFYIF